MAECRQEPGPAVFNDGALTGGQAIFNRVHFFQAHTTKPPFHQALSVTCSDLHSRLRQGPLHKRHWRRRGTGVSAAGCPVQSLESTPLDHQRPPQTPRMVRKIKKTCSKTIRIIDISLCVGTCKAMQGLLHFRLNECL